MKWILGFVAYIIALGFGLLFNYAAHIKDLNK
jgi:hypothetical protein